MKEYESSILNVYCSFCEVRTESKEICSYTKTERVAFHSSPEDSPYNVTIYTLSVCENCESVFLQEQEFYEIPGDVSALQGERILFPNEEKQIDKDIPNIVKKAYRNAVKSYTYGLYEPCVIMCRKCLEAICFELGEKKGSLNQRLLNLTKKNAIDTKLVDWANGLRLIGNEAVHDLDIEISKEDANDSIHFIEALLMYIFSLNRRFEEFQRRRKNQ